MEISEFINKNGEPSLVWDVSAIVENQVSFLKETNTAADNDELYRLAQADSDLFEIEYESLTEYLGEILKALNPEGYFSVTVKNFGWQSLSGHAQVDTLDGAEFLRKLLPKTDCTFKIYVRADSEGFYLAIQNFHHDSPVGNEWYEVRSDGDEREAA